MVLCFSDMQTIELQGLPIQKLQVYFQVEKSREPDQLLEKSTSEHFRILSLLI